MRDLITGQSTNLFRYFNKIELHDSNLFIFGKIDDDLNCSGVYSFSEVLEDESLGKIHDETETCLQQINSKSEIEEFNALEPILVINPNREKLGFSFHSKIMNHILEYEIEHGNHKWTFDITSNLRLLLLFGFRVIYCSRIKNILCFEIETRSRGIRR